MPTLRQLEYLVATIEHASFSRAADSLHISQPGLSTQVAALERELGCRLLNRLPSGVTPTPMGAAALGAARDALAAAARVSRVGRTADAQVEAHVTVATVYSVSIGILPAVVRRWRQAFPLVDIDVLEFQHVDAMREATASSGADLAVGPRPIDWPGAVRRLAQEQFVLLSSDDDLTEQPDGVIDLADLRDARWVHFAKHNGLADVLDQACRTAGFTPRTAVRTEQTTSAVALAGAGLGPTLVPANVVPADFPGRVLKPAVPIARDLVIYAHASPDSLVRALMNIDVPGFANN